MCNAVVNYMNLRRGKYVIVALEEHCLNGDAYTTEEALYRLCKRKTPELAYETYRANLDELLRLGTKYHYAPSFKMACYCCICFFRSKRRDALCLLYNIKHNREAVRPGREDKRKIIPKRFIPFPYRILAA